MEVSHKHFFSSSLRYAYLCVAHWPCFCACVRAFVAETYHIIQLIKFDKGLFTLLYLYSENHFHSIQIHPKQFDFGANAFMQHHFHVYNSILCRVLKLYNMRYTHWDTVICARLLWKVFASLLQPKWFINYWANQNRIADYGQIPLIYQYWLGLGIQSFTIRGNVCKVFFVGMRMFYHSFRSNFHYF